MLILTIRTDKPEAEIGLFEGEHELKYEMWQAHRALAETIHMKIDELLKAQQKELKDIAGIVVFKGPGSFTGLRIGITVANALADALGARIVSETEDTWALKGIARLQEDENEIITLPEYGGEPNVTQPKH